MGLYVVLWNTTPMLRITTLLALAAILLAGCSSTPPLEPKAAVNTGSVDLSGDWTLRGADGAPPKLLEDGEQPFRIPKRAANRKPERPQRSEGTAVRVFLETGRTVRISQTEYGLFISFDRAIVEEYTFGENRIVAVGPIQAQRVSGWDGNAFVVETRDKEGALLSESWFLSDAGETLVRRIAITKKDVEEFSAEQQFDRS